MNETLQKKNADLEKLRIRARTILTEFPNGLPAEQELAVKTIFDEVDKLRGEIDAEQKLQTANKQLSDLNRYLDNPVNKIPHGSNGDEDGRKMLAQAGWEVKAGTIHKLTSIGTSVPMYPESVLFGAIPDEVKADPAASEFYRITRASMSNEYRLAYSNLIKKTIRFGDAAISMLTGQEQKALSEGSDTAGGFVVPPDIQAEILARIPQWAVMRGMARVQPTNRDTLRFPAVAANTGTYTGVTNAGSIFSSGFVGSWAGETPAFTDTDLSWQAFDIPVKKVRCATRLSNDFINDAATNVLSYLAQNGAENMALVEDLGFIQGLGAALQPLGILNVPSISNTNVAGSTAHTISNTTSNTGSAPQLITLAYSLPAQYCRNAKWLMRRVTEGNIRTLVDANGRYLWPNYSEAGLTDGSPRALLGFPVVHSDLMPADGTSGNYPVILGDFSHYIIAQRTQVTSLILRERFMDTDQVGIILFERVGGAAFNNDAFRLGVE